MFDKNKLGFIILVSSNKKDLFRLLNFLVLNGIMKLLKDILNDLFFNILMLLHAYNLNLINIFLGNF